MFWNCWNLRLGRIWRKANEKIFENIKASPVYSFIWTSYVYGHYPNTWKFWAVVACAGLISILEYFDKDK